jgi:integrase
MARYARDVSPLKRGKRWEVTRLRTWPQQHALFAGPVEALDGPALADWRDARLRSVKSSSVNRELNLLSAVCNTAIKEWRVPGMKVNPVRLIKRPQNPKPRIRRVSAVERSNIVRQLGWNGSSQPAGANEWIAWAFSLALETAMRRGEILALTWQHVHLDRRTLHLPDTKNNYSRDVPLSSGALKLMKMVRAGGPDECVVPVNGGTFGELFGRAKAGAHLADLHFHDTRREAITVFASKLDSVLELAAISGHRSLDLLRKVYYQPDAEKLADKLG